MVDSVLSKRHNDCLACKLTSGFGLMGMGAYIYYYGNKKPKGLQRISMITLSIGTAYIGIARILNFFPFSNTQKNIINK